MKTHLRLRRRTLSSEREALAWLRRHINPLSWCQSRPDRRAPFGAHPVQVGMTGTTRSDIIRFYAARRLGKRCHLGKITNALIGKHVCGQVTLHGQADGRTRTRRCLTCIDIDCHDGQRGALAVVEWLRANGFRRLYWERSRRGLHAYLVVDKFDTPANWLDKALSVLERWLRAQWHALGWDISGIEVKGRPMLLEWGDDRGELIAVTSMGSMMTLPHDLYTRGDELMETTVKRVDWLRSLESRMPLGPCCGNQHDQDVQASSLAPLAADAIAAVPAAFDMTSDVEAFGDLDFDDLSPKRLLSKRDGTWPLWVEYHARHGLQAEDTMSEVVYELAAWLFWVEWYEGPMARQVQERVADALIDWVQAKHNDYVSRINDGRDQDVAVHVRRIVKSACTPRRQRSREFLEKIRDKRQSGQYARIITIAPHVTRLDALQQDNISSSYVPTLDFNPDPLPQDLEFVLTTIARANRLRRGPDGEYAFARFTRRLLYRLHANGGSARIHTQDLNTMSGCSDDKQQSKYRRLLVEANLITEPNGYQVGGLPKLYSLTPAGRQSMNETTCRVAELNAHGDRT